LAEAHVGVVPFADEQKFRVSSPIKLFEYMAAGMPILATRIDCHTDVVGQGNYVIWAEGSDEQALLDGLKKVWDVRQCLAKLGGEAAVASTGWTWAASAHKLAEAINKGIGERRAHTAGQRSSAVTVR
jgi:glycosyltransferase involved in cell wall biosynthesis